MCLELWYLQTVCKKLNPVVFLPQATAWTVRRDESERTVSVRGLLFLSALNMHLTGSEAFFKHQLFQCLK